jgi:CDP-paratose 2-epimerase
MRILVTGSAGLIGSEVAEYFAERDHEVYGIDNNQRQIFFGRDGSTRLNRDRLVSDRNNYYHFDLDIRDRSALQQLFTRVRPEAIVHAAAQPSHDLAATIPFDDFEVNAVGTLNLLEFARQNCPEAPFVYLSTNKVYGDRPNMLQMEEYDSRFEYSNAIYQKGISEDFPIDNSTHSLFGVSKLSADLMVQEYGRYFGMPTCCLRGGCLTGPNHSGVQLHGFLSYLIKCFVSNLTYRVIGHKGKQVRDNIHSYDVSSFINLFIMSPRSSAVYNIGGGYDNSVSIIESFRILEGMTGQKAMFVYDPSPRIGDHIVYYSNLDKIKSDYPQWTITKNISHIFSEIYESWLRRIS